MKKWLALIIVACIALLTMSFIGSYSKLWLMYKTYNEDDLPLKSLNVLSSIMDKAKKGKEIGHYFKAYTLYEKENIQLGKLTPKQSLSQLEEWLASEKSRENQAIISAILFSHYYHYYTEHRNAIVDRTPVVTSDSISSDVELWTITQFQDKLNYLFYRIFKDSELLRNKSSKDYTPFVEVNPYGKYFKHDLYHVLLWYVYPTVKEVLYTIDLKEVSIKKLIRNSLELYEENEEATLLLRLLVLLDMDLLHSPSYSLGDEELNQYKEIDALIEAYQKSELVVEAVQFKVDLLLNEKAPKYLEAAELCSTYIEKYPSYYRINSLKNSLRKILTPSISINTPNRIHSAESLVDSITYRNISDFELTVFKIAGLTDYLDEKDITEDLLKEKGVQVATLTQSNLYREDHQPLTLKNIDLRVKEAGYYVLKLNSSEMLHPSYSFLFVSDIDLVIISSSSETSHVEFIAVDGLTGCPVSDVVLGFYADEKLLGQAVTNSKGRAEWNKSDVQHQRVYAYYNGVLIQKISSLQIPEARPKSDLEDEVFRVTIFSDRSIYRPGQKVYIKGYAYYSGKKSRVLENFSDTVVIRDNSGAILARQSVKTNEFGTFSAELQLPEQLLTGSYRIGLTKRKYYGFTRIQVEEYKRPTFSIEFDPIQGKYKVGDSFVVNGRVQSFSSSSLKGVRVKAEVLSYDYNSSIRPIPFVFMLKKEERIISQNELELSSDGEFSLKVDTSKEQTRNVQVNITMTSLGGETHSERKYIWIEKDPYRLAIQKNNQNIEKQQKLELFVKASNSDGTTVDADGVAEISIKCIDEQGEAYYKPVKKVDFVANVPQLITLRDFDSGEYRIHYQGSEQSELKTYEYFTVYSDTDKLVPVQKGAWLHTINNSFTDTEPAEFLFGTAEEESYVFLNYYSSSGKFLSQEKVFTNQYQRYVIPYKKEYGDGIRIVIAYMKQHKLYEQTVELRKKTKQNNLEFKWTYFRDKTKPGSQQKWILQVLNHSKVAANSEVLALMYDASLDELSGYKSSFNLFSDSRLVLPFVETWAPTNYHYTPSGSFVQTEYLEVPSLLVDHFSSAAMDNIYSAMNRRGGRMYSYKISSDHAESVVAESAPVLNQIQANFEAPKPSNIAVHTRSNFSELAFFYPHLRTNKEGEVSIEFTSPEQLTKWRFIALAHQKDLSSAVLEEVVFTDKKFAIQLNSPRYIREGDKIALAAVLKNEEEELLNPEVELTLFDPYTNETVYSAKDKTHVDSHSESKVTFDLPAIKHLDALGIKVVASTPKYADGEQYILPVLPDKEPLVQGKSILIIDEGKSKTELADLFNNQSTSATNKKLTLEFSASPMWFTLPAILNVWNNTSDNTLVQSNQLIAGIIADQLITLYPAAFDKNKNWGTSYKQLLNNEQLKNIAMEETPWLTFAKSEAELLADVHAKARLFATSSYLSSLATQLVKDQKGDGGWSWHREMASSSYLTLHMAQTLSYFIKYKDLDPAAMLFIQGALGKAIHYLYRDLIKNNEIDEQHAISPYQLDIVLLSMEQENFEFSADERRYQKAIIDRLAKVLSVGGLLEKSKALRIAILTKDKSLAQKYYNSLREYLLVDNQGAHFGGPQFDGLYKTTQTVTHIEAMRSLYAWNPDEVLLSQMKYWLAMKLRNQHYMNGFALNDALLVLTQLGEFKDSSDFILELEIGEEKIKLDKEHPYVYRTLSMDNQTIEPLQLIKKGNEVIWGSAYASFNEELAHIEAQGEEVKVTTDYFIERVAGDKKVLVPLDEGQQIKIGEIVVSRIHFILKNDLDLVTIKDSRSAGLEPVNTSSGYQSGILMYGVQHIPSYVSVRDASTQYFYTSLRKGSYVLENRSYATHAGLYQSGIVTIQSMYAPEITGNSSSRILVIE